MPRPFNPAHPRTRDCAGRRTLQVYLPLDPHADIHDTARRRGISASEFVVNLLSQVERTPRRYRIHAKYRMSTFILGDCIPQMQALADASIRLIVTSPPYNIKKDYGTASDNLSLDEYIAFSKTSMTEAARLLHEDGLLWINVATMKDPDGGNLPIEYLLWPLGKELGLTLVQTVTWAHHTGRPQVAKIAQRTEHWLWFAKKTKGFCWNLDAVRVPAKRYDKRNHPLGVNPGDLWTYTTAAHAKGRPNHPCPFPIAMIERIVTACSNSGDTVLDPFGGSGSTALAAALRGRKFISIEIGSEFHETAVERFTAQVPDDLNFPS